MTDYLSIIFIIAALVATYTPAHSASNACYIDVRARGQYIVQASSEPGTISAYADGEYRTTVSRKGVLWYVTSDKDAVVRGYDATGLVC